MHMFECAYAPTSVRNNLICKQEEKAKILPKDSKYSLEKFCSAL